MLFLLFAGQLLIVPVAKSTVTSAVTQSGTAHCNGGVENNNTTKAKEVLENDGATPVQKRKSLPSVSTAECVQSLYLCTLCIYCSYQLNQ